MHFPSILAAASLLSLGVSAIPLVSRDNGQVRAVGQSDLIRRVDKNIKRSPEEIPKADEDVVDGLKRLLMQLADLVEKNGS